MIYNNDYEHGVVINKFHFFDINYFCFLFDVFPKTRRMICKSKKNIDMSRYRIGSYVIIMGNC
jgi:hypothetical protein